jgi:hypothetical protein
MIKSLLQSSLSTRVRIAIRLGIDTYIRKHGKDNPLNKDALTEEILGTLGDSIQDMLDIIKIGFNR